MCRCTEQHMFGPSPDSHKATHDNAVSSQHSKPPIEPWHLGLRLTLGSSEHGGDYDVLIRRLKF